MQPLTQQVHNKLDIARVAAITFGVGLLIGAIVAFVVAAKAGASRTEFNTG